MIGKIIAIAVCFNALVTQAAAQRLTVGLDGGLQGTQYPMASGQNKQLPGGSIDLLYNFKLGKSWNLLTGVTGGVYRTQATLPDGIAFSNYQVDDEGSAFQYSMKTKGYRETQQFFAAGIPLLFQYHTAGTGTEWYVDGGGKILLPAGASVAITAQQVTFAGYYPDYNVHISNVPQHGFGTITNWTASTTTQLKPAAALSAATGLSFRLSRSTRINTGIYIEYGLTNLKSKMDSLALVSYNPTGINGVQANGVLNTQNSGQLKFLSFGVQVRFSFGSAKTNSAGRSIKSKESSNPSNPSNPVTPPNPKTPTTISSPRISEDEAKVIQQPIVFGVLGEVNLPQIQKDHLDDVAAILMQYPGIRISIVGHICNSGTETEDTKVGLARARAVARYLHSKGISRSRMDVSAVDKSDPVLPFNPSANFQNRRAVMAIVQIN